MDSGVYHASCTMTDGDGHQFLHKPDRKKQVKKMDGWIYEIS